MLNDLPLHAQDARERYVFSERDTRELLNQAARALLLPAIASDAWLAT